MIFFYNFRLIYPMSLSTETVVKTILNSGILHHLSAELGGVPVSDLIEYVKSWEGVATPAKPTPSTTISNPKMHTESQPKASQSKSSVPVPTASAKSVDIVDYSNYSYVIVGEATRGISKYELSMCNWNPNLTHPQTKERIKGWRVQKTKYAEAEAVLKKHNIQFRQLCFTCRDNIHT